MSLANTKLLIKSMKPIIDEKLLYFAYHEGEPIGFFIMIPDLNQVARRLNGRFDLWGKLKFLYYLKVKKVAKRAVGIIFGVVPEFQGKGVDAGMIRKFAEVATQKGFQYNDLEFNWVGDFNPVMMRLMTQIGCSVRKRHVTYRIWFDPNKPFERCPKFGKARKPSPENE
jgi:GNAT superfamily N-acetyltransferase